MHPNLQNQVCDICAYLLSHRVFPPKGEVHLALFERQVTQRKLNEFLRQTSISSESIGECLIPILSLIGLDKTQWKALAIGSRFPGEGAEFTFDTLWTNPALFLEVLVALKKLSLEHDALTESEVRDEVLRPGLSSWQTRALRLAIELRRLQRVSYNELEFRNPKSEINRALKAVDEAQVRLQQCTSQCGPLETILGPIISLSGYLRAGRAVSAERPATQLIGLVQGMWPTDRLECAVHLTDIGQPACVFGKQKPALGKAAHKVVSVLINCFPSRISKDRLDKLSGRTDARKHLVVLRKKDRDWHRAVLMGEKQHLGYGLAPR